jgi:tRNA-2-methylthio-N6-dimethylallyladenosine synthase
MASLGFREVTLLGQNVNSYNDGNHSFASLLALCADVQDILRIRFMTSHPKDLTEEIMCTMASYPKICNHLHLPIQSGSDRILALMNRKYTRNDILNLIMNIRNLTPGVAITTDVIVGFPGETESDFQNTYNLIKTVRFDDAFTYHYSPRPGTRAALIKETLSQQDKLNRLDQIIRLQRRITSEKKNKMIGQTVEVLAEGVSKQSTQEWMGKTSTNHVIIFPKEKSKLGELVKVRIETCKGATLRGSIVHTETDASTPKPWRESCGS